MFSLFYKLTIRKQFCGGRIPQQRIFARKWCLHLMHCYFHFSIDSPIVLVTCGLSRCKGLCSIAVRNCCFPFALIAKGSICLEEKREPMSYINYDLFPLKSTEIDFVLLFPYFHKNIHCRIYKRIFKNYFGRGALV